MQKCSKSHAGSCLDYPRTESAALTQPSFPYSTERNQDKYSKCSTCGKEVQVSSMGKYCVRFGCYIKQFCSNACLEDHKKALKVTLINEVC